MGEKAVNKKGEPKHLNIGGELGLYDLHNVKNDDEANDTFTNSFSVTLMSQTGICTRGDARPHFPSVSIYLRLS